MLRVYIQLTGHEQTSHHHHDTTYNSHAFVQSQSRIEGSEGISGSLLWTCGDCGALVSSLWCL
jgi:hypothetical protein